jgi:hypothetical protein
MDGAKEAESKMMPIKEKVEFLTQIYDRMSSLAGNADTKAGFLLSFHGFWAISFGPHLAKLIIKFPPPPVKMIFWVISFALVCSFFIAFIRSAYKSALILKPRIEPQIEHKPNKPSLIFFADVIKMSGTNVSEKADSYRKQLDETNYEDLIDDLVYRINDMSYVVSAKYSCATEAIRRSLISFSLWAISLIALVIMNMF